MTYPALRRTLRAALLPTLTAALLPCSGAEAAQPASFTCAASATTVRALDGASQAPVSAGADRTTCRHAVTGLQDAGDVLAKDSGLQAATAYAAVDPGGDAPATSSPTAQAGVEGLSLASAGLPLAVDAARSSLTAGCAKGKPTFTPASRVGSITLGDTPLVVDGVVQPVTDGLSDALHAVVSVRLNEVVSLPGGGKAVRAAHVTVGEGENTLADVVVAESRIDLSGAACDPVDGGKPTVLDPGLDICPDGSALNAGTGKCVIPVPGSTSADNPAGDLTGAGSVVVGRPSSGPSGGTVVSLAVARKRYSHDPCVRGAGPAYVVVGDRGTDRITGTNHADRILGLGGGDKLDGGRGNDCASGGAGRDAMTGGQGNDRVYGGTSRDLVNGDAGNDRLHGGAGNDTLNAAYGADRVYAGAGRDKVNVATAGRNAMVRGGRGWDKVRCNPREVHRISGVERVIVTRRVR